MSRIERLADWYMRPARFAAEHPEAHLLDLNETVDLWEKWNAEQDQRLLEKSSREP